MTYTWQPIYFCPPTSRQISLGVVEDDKDECILNHHHSSTAPSVHPPRTGLTRTENFSAVQLIKTNFPTPTIIYLATQTIVDGQFVSCRRPVTITVRFRFRALLSCLQFHLLRNNRVICVCSMGARQNGAVDCSDIIPSAISRPIQGSGSGSW